MKVLRVLLAACFITLITGSFGWASDRVDLDKVGPVSKFQATELPIAGYLSRQSAAADPEKSAKSNYNAFLRIYVVELTSLTYYDNNGLPYDFALANFGLDSAVSIPYLDTHQITKTVHHGSVIAANNVMVIAVLFNAASGGTNYSDPPLGAPFTIHYVDAAAKATPDHPGWDTAYGVYTHTVFLEEATSMT